MVDVVNKAFEAARKAQEAAYSGRMTVYEHKKVKDEKTQLTAFNDVAVLKDIPCKLSFQSKQAAADTVAAMAVSQTIKLFTAPDIIINPGSKITVTQNGVTKDYTYSGVPAVYVTHQEIVLELFERWA